MRPRPRMTLNVCNATVAFLSVVTQSTGVAQTLHRIVAGRSAQLTIITHDARLILNAVQGGARPRTAPRRLTHSVHNVLHPHSATPPTKMRAPPTRHAPRGKASSLLVPPR